MTEFWILAGVVTLVLLAVYFLLPGVVYTAAMRLERALAGLRTRALEIDGIRYRYLDSGDGVPLLLLHGFTADMDNWTRVARYLTGEFRVIAPDLPGFGKSTADPALDYSIDSQVDRVHRLVERLGLAAFHLGGSSMGGAIAAIYASRYPQQVSSLWLLAPGGVVTGEPSEMEQILAAGEGHPLIPGDRRQFEATLDFVFTRRPFLPRPVRRHLALAAARRQALYRQIFTDLLDENGRGMHPSINPVAARLDLPVLVVWGERDRVLHPAGAEKLRELLVHDTASIEVMPDMGHLPMLEAPRRTAGVFLAFQRGLERVGAQ